MGPCGVKTNGLRKQAKIWRPLAPAPVHGTLNGRFTLGVTPGSVGSEGRWQCTSTAMHEDKFDCRHLSGLSLLPPRDLTDRSYKIAS